MNSLSAAPQATSLAASRRLRRTPYTERVEALGVRDFSVVNHMLLPKGFTRTVAEDYAHLHEHVQLWDVSCQRQVQLAGPQAMHLAQIMTPRDLRQMVFGKGLYVPLVDETGGLINDPVAMRIDDNKLWFSIADSDVLLWAKGLATGFGLDVDVSEPDVSPLAIQGPKADELAARVFGKGVRELRYFGFDWFDFRGHPLIVARSGYSKQGGFEVYLDDSSLGLELWDACWDAGADLDVAPGCPNLPERVEGGLLSFGNDMTRDNNPLECGMTRWCQLDGSVDYLGLKALQDVARTGPQRQVRGVILDAQSCPPCHTPWPVTADGRWAGQVTTAAWSPRFSAIVGIAMMERGAWEPGQVVRVTETNGTTYDGAVYALPF